MSSTLTTALLIVIGLDLAVCIVQIVLLIRKINRDRQA